MSNFGNANKFVRGMYIWLEYLPGYAHKILMERLRRARRWEYLPSSENMHIITRKIRDPMNHQTTLNTWMYPIHGGFSDIIRLWVTLNYLFFTIPPPQIWILPKPWFPIMGVAPPYPNLTTDNSFSNPCQSIRGKSIRSPLYLSNDLYHVGHRHKCPHNSPTQQGYFPVQVSERWVSSESTQGRLRLWSRVGMT